MKKSGLLVGRVSSITFDANNDILVTISMNESYQLRKKEMLTIANSLLGDGELQVIENPELKDQAGVYQGNEMVVSAEAKNPLNVVNDLGPEIAKTLAVFQETGKSIDELAKAIKKPLADQGGDKIGVMIDNLGKTQEEVREAIKAIKEVSLNVGETIKSINKVVANDKFPEELRMTMKDIQEMIKATTQIAKNIEEFTKPLNSEQAKESLRNLSQTVERMNGTLAQIEQFSKQLNSREGTVGQLLHNPQLYQELNEAAENINEVSRRIRPIVEDLRVVSDKVARNPGVILRDAVQPGAGVKFSTPER